MLGVADTHYRLDKLILLEVTLGYRDGFAVRTPLRVSLQAARDEDVFCPCRRERTLQASTIRQQSDAAMRRMKCRLVSKDHLVGAG